MKENEEFQTRPRPGVGCDPGASPQFEVLPPERRRDRGAIIGPVTFDRQTILNSPCFWMLGGIAIGFAAAYYFGKSRR